jgi:hypothetical protein
MPTFDQLVNKTVSDIAAARRDQQNLAKSAAQTAENMFGQVGAFISELRPRLAKEFPDQQPSVSLDDWKTTATGATNTIELARVGAADKQITLAVTFGASDVLVNGDKLPTHGIIDVIAAEIGHFFKA